MVEVVATDEFRDWYLDLEQGHADSVTVAVEQLQELGVALGFPKSSAINGSAYPLRELRIQSGGEPLRVFYVFDPKRQAVLLIGGNKGGDNRFYEVFVPQADKIYTQYLKEEAEREAALKAAAEKRKKR